MSFFKQLFATRKNPYKPWANQRDRVEIDLSGTRLSMELPPHSNIEGFTRDPAPASVNIYDESQYDSDEHLPDWQQSGVSVQSLFDRDWEFLGAPWRQWPYGSIKIAVSVLKFNTLPAGMSCFNEEHFEQLLIRDLYFQCPMQPDRAKRTAPINWRLQKVDRSKGIYFEIHYDLSSPEPHHNPFDAARTNSCLYLPIDHKLCLLINFNYMGYEPVEDSLKNMNEIRDQVIDTVHIQLSQSAQQEQQDIIKRWPAAQATKHRQAEHWTYPEWRSGDRNKEEPEIVIMEPGSVAPPLNI